jgi:hypothetical protein
MDVIKPFVDDGLETPISLKPLRAPADGVCALRLPVVEEHTVLVAIGPGGQLVAVEDSHPAQIRVHGEAVEEIPQLPPALAEK